MKIDAIVGSYFAEETYSTTSGDRAAPRMLLRTRACDLDQFPSCRMGHDRSPILSDAIDRICL